MPERTFLSGLTLSVLCLCAMLAGCGDVRSVFGIKAKKTREKSRIIIPAHIKGTVAEYATLIGSQVPLQTHGLVIALGDNGSSEVPTNLRKPITKYLLRSGLQSYRLGTESLTPERVLADKDTSVVLVGGSAPLGAPVGATFDVFVASLPQTQTRSLDGGLLMPIELSVAFGGRTHSRNQTHSWGIAAGPIFVNPFIDPTNPLDAAKLKTGRIIGGGKITISRAVRLQLHRPDYQLADRIRRAILNRFEREQDLLLAKVAKAKNRSTIELRVPPEYRYDYRHFLDLVMHLPVRFGSGSPEAHARRIAAQMELPTANHHELALVWEAMGREVVPLARELYESNNQAAAFYAARTAVRLGDSFAEDVILRFATTAGSPYQIQAIRQLAQDKRIVRATNVLRKLLDDSNERVRIAAYEALRKRRDSSTVRTIDVAEQFQIDLVSTTRDYTIYVAQTGKPRIALFGKNMTVHRQVYFESPDELVTINAFADSKKLMMFRKIPHIGRTSEPFYVDFAVSSMIQTLGSLPRHGADGKIMGLGLTYSQIVGVLYRMCKQGDISAKFILQPADNLERIYGAAMATGRPDLPSP